jgi:hypothetical protein
LIYFKHLNYYFHNQCKSESPIIGAWASHQGTFMEGLFS